MLNWALVSLLKSWPLWTNYSKNKIAVVGVEYVVTSIIIFISPNHLIVTHSSLLPQLEHSGYLHKNNLKLLCCNMSDLTAEVWTWPPTASQMKPMGQKQSIVWEVVFHLIINYWFTGHLMSYLSAWKIPLRPAVAQKHPKFLYSLWKLIYHQKWSIRVYTVEQYST